MSWHITHINNATHKVILRHVDGHMTEVTIPEEHRGNGKASTAFVKSHTDAHDAKRLWDRYKVRGLIALSSIEFVMLVAVGIYLKLRH